MRLRIQVSERILNSAFLLTLGLGYAFALANLWYTHQARDGQRGLSIRDVMIAYHGSGQRARLEAAIEGIMEPNLKYKSDKEVILKWIHNGATEAEYREKTAPIFNRDCIVCHSPEVNPSLPDLRQYEGALEVARASGTSLPALIRISHIHLFGIAFILYLVGRIFILSDINITLKRVTVAIPFLAMLLDVMAWYVTKYLPGFAYLVVGAGALMGLSMWAQILISLYQMWFHRVHPEAPNASLSDRAAACRSVLEVLGFGLNPVPGGWHIRDSTGAHHEFYSIEALEHWTHREELKHRQSD